MEHRYCLYPRYLAAPWLRSRRRRWRLWREFAVFSLIALFACLLLAVARFLHH